MTRKSKVTGPSPVVGIRCAIYTRKSTEEGLEQEFNTLDAQRESGEAYVKSQQHEGWVCLPDRYDDGGFTGGNNASDAKGKLLKRLKELIEPKSPSLAYYLILFHLFKNLGVELDEERIVKSATGIRNTTVWKRLFKFQRDGVIGAIDKLDRFGGCIIADSVGLGKTFEALAIIKYHELRNDRVLVLVPKRLRDNWTLYKANDRRNILAADRFNYDVLNHTDLSRDGGMSGDIDLSHVNWGNYDLVVIDESHNFRNKKTPRAGGETRYDRLMHRIIQQGVKTRVLMLSATPVNNRLADLRNQIAFATEGDDTALVDAGIGSIDATTRLAQKQFNRWLALDDHERTSTRLIDMLGFDYFTLLDLLTIARSRKHVEKYYGTVETGRFPGLRFHLDTESFAFYQPQKMQGDALWIDVTELMQRGTSGLGDFVARLSQQPTLALKLGDYVGRLPVDGGTSRMAGRTTRQAGSRWPSRSATSCHVG